MPAAAGGRGVATDGRLIVAMGGGGFQMEPDNLLLDDHVLALGLLFQRLVAAGTLPAGFGVDDGAALVFGGRELVEVVTSHPDATAWRVAPDGAGGTIESRLSARFLGG